MILMTAVILVCTSSLNFQGLGKPKLIFFGNRFKTKNRKDTPNNKIETNETVIKEEKIEVQKTEAESVSGIAL